MVGTVSAIEAEYDAARETPFTYVTFTDLDIGETDQTELTLRFLGGPRPDGTALQIAGVPVGERNVLFVTDNDTMPRSSDFGKGSIGWSLILTATPTRSIPTTCSRSALPAGGGNILHDEGHADHQTHALHSAEPLSLESFSQSRR